MAKDKLSDYDGTTASNNTDIGGVSIAEGMLPSNVNNSMRELTKQLGAFADGTDGVDVLKLQDDTDTNSIKLQAPASVTATTTFTLPDGDGTADQVLKTDGSGQLGFADRHANPSLIINGGMQVAQRGTSATGLTSNGYYTCDRFRVQITIGTHTVEQSTDAPDGFSNSWKIDCTTADATPSASGYLLLNHFIEAQNLQGLGFGTSEAKPLTLSFWVKSNKTGNASFEIEQIDNSNKMAGFQYTINAANTWEYKTISIPADTSGVINNDNGAGFQLNWWLNGGTNFTSGSHQSTWTAFSLGDTNPSNLGIGGATSDYWQITGVKLEVGDTDTPFFHRSYGEELALCQRYYEKSGSTAEIVSNGWENIRYATAKRASPTVNVVVGSGSLSGVAGNISGFRFNNATADYATFTADAEL